MLDRLLTYLSVFILIALFVLVADPTQRVWILVGLGLSLVAVTITLLNNTLSIDGAAAALVIGTMALGLGGITGAVLLLFFFSSSYGLSWWLDRRPLPEGVYGYRVRNRGSGGHHHEVPGIPDISAEPFDERKAGVVTERRKGMQVWANAFWFVLFLILYVLFDDFGFLVASAAGITAAAADTWSSIAGVRLGGSPRLITTLRRIPAGTDGAVSQIGLIAGLSAALVMSIIFQVTQLSIDPWAWAIVLISGFLGCIADSYLGAIFQYHRWMHQHISLMKRYAILRPLKVLIPNNDSVNFLATGIAAILAYVLY